MSTCRDICLRHKKPFQLVCENDECTSILCSECWLYANSFISEAPSEISYYCYDCIQKKRLNETNSLNDSKYDSSTQDSDKTTVLSFTVNDHFLKMKQNPIQNQVLSVKKGTQLIVRGEGRIVKIVARARYLIL